MKNFNYVYGGLWLATLFGGAICYNLVPESFQYITAFVTGTFSYMFLRLTMGK